jgi:hypothetical protein
MNKRYQGIKVTKNDAGKRYYVNNIYPEVLPTENDIYVIAVEEDRYDLLANEYYGDKTYWWIIPAANNLACDSLYPPLGLQLRIPTNIDAIIRSYNTLNQ